MSKQMEQTQNQETQRIPNRRERRFRLKQQGVLRYLSKLSFFDPIRANFRAENIRTGVRIQEIRRTQIEAEHEAYFEAKLESMKETWYELGYNAEEIALLEEATAIRWTSTKENYRKDKKEALALTKKAAELRASRQ